MSIKKQYFRSKSLCRVTFRVQKKAEDEIRKIHVVGEFNKWDRQATPMKSYKNGSFSVSLDLDLNEKYQFRYFIDDMVWQNDQDADTFVHCPFGNCDNSVIIT